jgi:hypothetical protein
VDTWQTIWDSSVMFYFVRREGDLVSAGPLRIKVDPGSAAVLVVCVALPHPNRPWTAQPARAYALDVVFPDDLEGEELLRAGISDAPVVGELECSWTGKDVSAQRRAEEVDSSDLTEEEIIHTLVSRMLARQKKGGGGSGGGGGGRGGRKKGKPPKDSETRPRRTHRTSRSVRSGEDIPERVGDVPISPSLQRRLDAYRSLTPNAVVLPYWADHPGFRRMALALAGLEHPVRLTLVTGEDAQYKGDAPVVEKAICYVPAQSVNASAPATGEAEEFVAAIRRLAQGAVTSPRPLSEIVDDALTQHGRWLDLVGLDATSHRKAANVESVLLRVRDEPDSPDARRSMQQLVRYLPRTAG